MPAAVEPGGARRFTDVRRVAETGSTNTDLMALARVGGPEGVVLVTDHQTQGRGRLGRSWEAPPGASLLVSVLCRPALPVARAHLVTVAAALAAADAVAAVAGFRPGLKWPNDLVVERDGATRKLAGLLGESLVEGGALAAVVVGMGMNVQWPEPLPEALAPIATAVNHEAGRPVAPVEVLDAWLPALDRRYDELCAPDGAEVTAAAHRAACVTIGRPVRVELADRTLEGDAVDVDEDGHLVVVVDGRRRSVAVGDVVHLRPGGPPAHGRPEGSG